MNLGNLKTESVYKAFLNLGKMLKKDEYAYSEKLKMLEDLKKECDISLLNVIILNERKEIRSDFFWNDCDINNTTMKKFLYNNLFKLFEESMKAKEYLFLDSNEKIYKIKNTAQNSFMFLPVKNIQEDFCIGGILVGRKKENGNWTKEETTLSLIHI